MLAAADTDGREVAIDGDVTAVANHYRHGSSDAEDIANLAVKDAAGMCTGLSFDVNTFIVEGNVLQSLDNILAKVADNAIGTRNRHGQASTVALEIPAEATILGRHGEHFF